MPSTPGNVLIEGFMAQRNTLTLELEPDSDSPLDAVQRCRARGVSALNIQYFELPKASATWLIRICTEAVGLKA